MNSKTGVKLFCILNALTYFIIFFIIWKNATSETVIPTIAFTGLIIIHSLFCFGEGWYKGKITNDRYN